ncbi:11101_t:CDS:2 [Dentiscutata erythropus]|uniref:11101_t:CDS:1 n=1 Tax=Dentiscutata erythropus TaxID=1348616 RepID=A0A9N8W7X3_9GLOM|nr:11101_t:CDS:2 [Dentiscutata erythropus]
MELTTENIGLSLAKDDLEDLLTEKKDELAQIKDDLVIAQKALIEKDSLLQEANDRLAKQISQTSSKSEVLGGDKGLEKGIEITSPKTTSDSPYYLFFHYSKIMKPNTVHQCDLIEIPYDENVDTNLLLDDGPIFYYILLVIDCATRYKDFVFLTSKSSEEVAEAFKSIYDNPDKPLNWPRKLQCDKDTEFIGYMTLLMDEHGIEI